MPFFLPSSTWAKSAVLGDAFRTADLAPGRASPPEFSSWTQSGKLSAAQACVFVCGLLLHVDITLTYARGGQPPGPPLELAHASPHSFSQSNPRGCTKIFCTKSALFSPGLGLREGWLRLIRYRSFFEFDRKCRRNLINYDFF